MKELYQKIKELYESGDYDTALPMINNILDDDPSNPNALFMFGNIMMMTGKKGLAYNIFARCAKLAPEAPEAWINFGRCQPDNEEGWAKSEWCFQKALELNPESIIAMGNMSSILIQQMKIKEAREWAEKAMKINPDYTVVRSCLGFINLMEKNWKEGFQYYHDMLGTPTRPDYTYEGCPEWDGSPGKTIIVNGEQGIGDELIYSSFIRDVAQDNKVIYLCMPRLERLMKRSLDHPNIYVTGQRWADEVQVPEGWIPDAKISQAGLGMFIREKDEDFKGKSCLKADPDLRNAIRGMLDGISDKPKVGIAWTGGTKQSRMQFRQSSLDQMTAFLRNDDVDFISLQYKDPSEEIETFKKTRGITIHHFPLITEAKEYDYTAALVAELDLVIAVPTSATQLAGALGTETWVLVPDITGWLFYPENYVWADTVKLYHKWKAKNIEKQLRQWINKDDRRLYVAH